MKFLIRTDYSNLLYYLQNIVQNFTEFKIPNTAVEFEHTKDATKD